jgi:hypothetical protein
MRQSTAEEQLAQKTPDSACVARNLPESATDKAPVQLTADAMELTSDIGRDAPADPIVVAANNAFERIENHRRLFRRDWLPFLDGVYHLSLQAWKSAGRRTRLNGKPDWGHDRVQVEFRKAIRGLPWEHYFESRRTLLSVLRKIGGDRERFLEWYDDNNRADMRECVGHPETLWRMFEKVVPRRAPAGQQEQREDAADSRADEPVDEKAAARTDAKATDEAPRSSVNAKTLSARTDAERMADLVVRNEKWHDFGAMLLDSMNDGRSTLEAPLHEKLDYLLAKTTRDDHEVP